MSEINKVELYTHLPFTIGDVGCAFLTFSLSMSHYLSLLLSCPQPYTHNTSNVLASSSSSFSSSSFSCSFSSTCPPFIFPSVYPSLSPHLPINIYLPAFHPASTTDRFSVIYMFLMVSYILVDFSVDICRENFLKIFILYEKLYAKCQLLLSSIYQKFTYFFFKNKKKQVYFSENNPHIHSANYSTFKKSKREKKKKCRIKKKKAITYIVNILHSFAVLFENSIFVVYTDVLPSIRFSYSSQGDQLVQNITIRSRTRIFLNEIN